MERHHWREAEEARSWLQERPMCCTVLYLLSRLPFLDIRVLHQLAGQHGPASMYRSVARLEQAGLLSSIQPPVYGPNPPRLFYLADLGLATVGLDLGCDPQHLAERFHLRGADLLKMVPTLPRVLDVYELLGALAASRSERPTLLAWERPWRRRYARLGGKTYGSITLPAYAVFSWGDKSGCYLLLPDAGVLPLRLQQVTIEHLVMLRRTQSGRLPVLLIATTDRDRMVAWERLIHEVARARRETPLGTRIVRWDDLHHGLADIPSEEDSPTHDELARPFRLPPLQPRRPDNLIPCLVGDQLIWPAQSDIQEPSTAALSLTPTDYQVLEVTGFHPFLTANQLSHVLGRSESSIRRRLNHLVALGLIRFLSIDESSEESVSELSELTTNGLKRVAADLGLSLATAVRELGLVGGGPDDPVGSRCKLVRTLPHTRGVDEVFVGLYRQAGERSAAGHDEEVVEWQNAAACSRRHLRPDGYGVYRHGSHYEGFFLEYDRGTMNARDYFKKFGAYYRYGTTGRFERDYNSYPTILVVTTDNAAEERIARVARALAVGQHGMLPLLLTCQWRINDRRNPNMLLGRIWRMPEAIFVNRQHWLPDSPSRVTSVLLHSKTQTRHLH
jgi:DNA-binding MarR family transcriptional regulator